MKIMTGLFGFGLAGIALCFVMTVVTAVQEYRQKQVPVSSSLPVPAVAQ